MRAGRAAIVVVIAGCGGSHAPAPATPASAPEATPAGAQPVTPETDEQAYREASPEQIFDIMSVRFAGRDATVENQIGLFDLKDYFAKHPAVTLVRIGAHTGDIGEPADRMKLTKDRALAIAHWLVEHGVDCHRILPVGFGSAHPPDRTNPYAPPADRTDVFKVAIRGHLLGTAPPEGDGEVAGDPSAQ